MYVFRNGASSSTWEGSVPLCGRYVLCTAVSAREYLRCPDVEIAMDSVYFCHYTALGSIYTRHAEVSCQCRLVQQVMPELMKLLLNCS
jgi:hypothetical protein